MRRTLKLQYSLKHFFENWVSGSREKQKRTQQTITMTDAGKILIFFRRAHWSQGDIKTLWILFKVIGLINKDCFVNWNTHSVYISYKQLKEKNSNLHVGSVLHAFNRESLLSTPLETKAFKRTSVLGCNLKYKDHHILMLY